MSLEADNYDMALKMGALIPGANLTTGSISTAKLADDAVTSAKIDESVIQTVTVNLTKAQILAMYTTPVAVVAAPGALKALEFLSAVIVYDRVTATYGGGGNVAIYNGSGGAVVSQVISAANSFGASADAITQCVALDTANGIPLTENTGLFISNATGVFTDPGTAAGTAQVKVSYRVHSLLLT